MWSDCKPSGVSVDAAAAAAVAVLSEQDGLFVFTIKEQKTAPKAFLLVEKMFSIYTPDWRVLLKTVAHWSPRSKQSLKLSRSDSTGSKIWLVQL